MSCTGATDGAHDANGKCECYTGATLTESNGIGTCSCSTGFTSDDNTKTCVAISCGENMIYSPNYGCVCDENFKPDPEDSSRCISADVWGDDKPVTTVPGVYEYNGKTYTVGTATECPPGAITDGASPNCKCVGAQYAQYDSANNACFYPELMACPTNASGQWPACTCTAQGMEYYQNSNICVEDGACLDGATAVQLPADTTEIPVSHLCKCSDTNEVYDYHARACVAKNDNCSDGEEYVEFTNQCEPLCSGDAATGGRNVFGACLPIENASCETVVSGQPLQVCKCIETATWDDASQTCVVSN